MGELVTSLVHHLVICDHEAVLHGVIVQLGSRIGMSYGNLDGLDIQFFRKLDGVADGLPSLTRQSQNEVSMDDQAQLVTILGELTSPFNGRAFLDVLQNLLVAVS